MKSIVLMCVVVFVGSISFAANRKISNVSTPSSIEAEKLIQESTCQKQIESLINNWGATRDWQKKMSNMDGGKVFLSSLGKIGFWANFTFYPDHSAEASRFAPDSTLYVTWNSSCVPQITTDEVKPVKAPKGVEFVTDQTIQDLLGEGRPVLVYAWSPNMPLSVNGFHEARGTAIKMGVSFLPVLDPEADQKTALKIIKEKHFPKEAIKRNHAIELMIHDMGIHYPSSLIITRNGSSLLYPGLWVSLEAYENFIKENIK